MPSRATLRFRCFGGFSFSGRDRWRVPPARARGGVLLAYLASHSRSAIFRETLSAAFWPELNVDQRAHRLHLAVSGARAAVRRVVTDINPIIFTNDAYAWHPSLEVKSDIDDLDRCFNNGSPPAFREGVEIYAGHFLPGDHSDWVLPIRVRYEQIYVTMLESLARWALQCGEYGRATNFALRLVEVDRANELAIQLAMLSAANAGHRATALAQFESLERYLKRWLGVEPTAATRLLRAQILKGEIPRDFGEEQKIEPALRLAGGCRSAL